MLRAASRRQCRVPGPDRARTVACPGDRRRGRRCRPIGAWCRRVDRCRAVPSGCRRCRRRRWPAAAAVGAGVLGGVAVADHGDLVAGGVDRGGGAGVGLVARSGAVLAVGGVAVGAARRSRCRRWSVSAVLPSPMTVTWLPEASTGAVAPGVGLVARSGAVLAVGGVTARSRRSEPAASRCVGWTRRCCRHRSRSPGCPRRRPVRSASASVWLPDPVPSWPSVVSPPPEPAGRAAAGARGWSSASLSLPSPITVTWLPEASTGAVGVGVGLVADDARVAVLAPSVVSARAEPAAAGTVPSPMRPRPASSGCRAGRCSLPSPDRRCTWLPDGRRHRTTVATPLACRSGCRTRVRWHPRSHPGASAADADDAANAMPRTVNPPAIAVAHSVRRTEVRMCCSLTESDGVAAARSGHGVVRSRCERRTAPQSGEEPGGYAGPAGQPSARRHEWRSSTDRRRSRATTTR